MIEDEKGLVTVQLFRSMFFMYFKGETNAYQVYEMLLPLVTRHYIPELNEFIDESDTRANDSNKYVVIQQLT